MTEMDKHIIKGTLKTLIELTYSNMYQIPENVAKGKKHIELLESYEEALLKQVEEELFKS
ncbi:MAG: hypothetical protein J0L69_12885 [Bacteroidetes bacterium]|nr:hypothetical protein [Bacteroidota bacterium]